MRLEALKESLSTLIFAYDAYKEDKKNALIRDAVVKRYEYTYETALKMIKRRLKETILSEANINSMNFNDFIRTANEANLLSNTLSQWQSYREQRNATSHTYSAHKAEALFSILSQFIAEMKFLLQSLNELNK